MLVLDENRLMGVSPEHFQQLERMILRNRNHPCVIIWSFGNEEWSIEGNIKGARIASTMQAFVKRLDPTRRVTAAISGGWGQGISTVIDLMGYNYIAHGNIDEHHAKFPNEPSVLTEEGTTSATRGVYEDDRPNAHMAPSDRGSSGRRFSGRGIERGIQFCCRAPLCRGIVLLDRLRLSRRGKSLRLAPGFFRGRHPRPLRFPERYLLLSKSVLDR